jgi:hypothetical protein
MLFLTSSVASAAFVPVYFGLAAIGMVPLIAHFTSDSTRSVGGGAHDVAQLGMSSFPTVRHEPLFGRAVPSLFELRLRECGHVLTGRIYLAAK